MAARSSGPRFLASNGTTHQATRLSRPNNSLTGSAHAGTRTPRRHPIKAGIAHDFCKHAGIAVSQVMRDSPSIESKNRTRRNTDLADLRGWREKYQPPG